MIQTACAASPALIMGSSCIQKRGANGLFTHLIGTVAIFLCVAALDATATSTHPLIPENSTVVLLRGLPGDLESETTFRDHLQTWMEILQTTDRVREIFLLADNPESVSLATNLSPRLPTDTPAGQKISEGAASKPQLATRLLKADRSNFLSLAQSLAGKTNPVVVIAFGHGGKQGSIPVLHVRGPRLIPDDFDKLASQLASADSHWILLFRGSGAFARQLAHEGRRILSSECDTIFASDPVEMSLLLKILRADPIISFQALGEQVGAATANWYDERHLARTEEPTYWLGKDKPVLLAKSENSLASVKPEDTSPAQPQEPSKPRPVSKELPVGWKNIERIEPGKFPDADAVVLRRRFEYTLGSSPAITSEQDEFIQILSLEGKRFGDFDIAYSPPFEDINFIDCEVLRPNGELVRLDPDAIREAGEQSLADYHTGRRKFFSLPGVAPGAILHVHFRTLWKEFPLPHVSLEIPIERELPVLDLTLQVAVPKNTAFHFAFENLPVPLAASSQPSALESPSPSPDPTVKQTTYGSSYSWHFDNLRVRPAEILAPPRSHSRLMVSTFPDWAAFAQWYARISQRTGELTPEISAKASELAQSAGNEREKVLALYNYVASLRYVAVPLGVNSFRPHAVANVFQNQFGDCKDKANLFNAMLHSLKIPADLVLVPRFSQAHDAVPGFAFNHAISRVTLPAETLWVDTTDDVCRFGMLPPGDPGRNVLVIASGTNTLTQLPKPAPAEHLLRLNGEINCGLHDDAPATTLNVVASGYPDYELRSTARESRDHNSSLPLLSARFRPSAGSFALEKQSSTSVAALDENFSWQAEGAWIGIVSSAAILAAPKPDEGGQVEKGTVRDLRAPFWLPKEWDAALHHRSSGLFLNQGYPLTLDEHLVFSFPAALPSRKLPAKSENQLPPLRWRVEWAQGAEAKVSAKLRAELVQGELSFSETIQFQQQLRALLAALSATAGVGP